MERVTQQEIEEAISRASREVFETMLLLPLEIDASVMRTVVEPGDLRRRRSSGGHRWVMDRNGPSIVLASICAAIRRCPADD